VYSIYIVVFTIIIITHCKKGFADGFVVVHHHDHCASNPACSVLHLSY